jgi:hypothetical protein
MLLVHGRDRRRKRRRRLLVVGKGTQDAARANASTTSFSAEIPCSRVLDPDESALNQLVLSDAKHSDKDARCNRVSTRSPVSVRQAVAFMLLMLPATSALHTALCTDTCIYPSDAECGMRMHSSYSPESPQPTLSPQACALAQTMVGLERNTPHANMVQSARIAVHAWCSIRHRLQECRRVHIVHHRLQYQQIPESVSIPVWPALQTSPAMANVTMVGSARSSPSARKVRAPHTLASTCSA